MLNRFGTFIYNHLIQLYHSETISGKIKYLIFYSLRYLLTKITDPKCKMKIRDKLLNTPLSHPLAYHVTKFPHYDGLIERLANFIRGKYNRLICIDVGANIGDTIIFCSPQENDLFLGLEADEHYIKYFMENVGYLDTVELVKTICSSSDGKIAWTTQREYGTARIVKSSQSNTIKRSLDSLIKEYDKFEKANFLKIDTDGHDFEVIKGAKNFIAKNRPTILFECDYLDNKHYVEDFRDVMYFFHICGYKTALVYDNFGFFFGKIPLNNISQFKYSLFYQLTSDFYYFDILVMKEDDIKLFLPNELLFFINKMDNQEVKKTTIDATQL